ncbi:uncharacterized protein LOC106164804 isoform X2 [Lingula anatina]|uniref:Uncharacterized protein LOC106164804 isoform X2 n=1 Tax=Lingula anatina TaxID=7574 RepID=A0A1S3IJ96_LINAN|nr:uncharacterized protein LOC106164804 isoform X2 [Lingula anatina]|eukprot:XP_013398287.1 uncharacterized protein LOC106164804 isoform X2 [Lingula anatina]
MGSATVLGIAFLVSLCNAGVVKRSGTCTPLDLQGCMQDLIDYTQSKAMSLEAMPGNYTPSAQDLKEICNIYPRVIECIEEVASRDSCDPQVARLFRGTAESLQSSVNASCGLLERNLTLPNQECMQRYTMAAERRCKPKTEFLGMMIGKAMAGTATESSVCSAMRRLVKCHIKVVTKKCDEEFANFIKNTLVDSLSKAMPEVHYVDSR